MPVYGLEDASEFFNVSGRLGGSESLHHNAFCRYFHKEQFGPAVGDALLSQHACRTATGEIMSVSVRSMSVSHRMPRAQTIEIWKGFAHRIEKDDSPK